MSDELSKGSDLPSSASRSSGTLRRLPKVRDFMTEEVHTLTPDTPILDAVDLLVSKRISGAPVVDADHRIVGVLSEKDCLKLVAKGVGHGRPSGHVADFMSAEVKTVSPGMDVYYVAGLFLNEVFRRFPVADADGRLVGQISRVDVLRAVRAFLVVVDE